MPIYIAIKPDPLPKRKFVRYSLHSTYEASRKRAVKDKLKIYEITKEGLMFQLWN